MGRYVRLNKKGFIFKDRGTGFTIQKGEVKPLPPILGEHTRLWLQAGGLELCGPPQETVAPSEAPILEVTEAKPDAKTKEDRVAELEKLEIATIRQMCLEKGIKFGYRSSKATLITKIVDN